MVAKPTAALDAYRRKRDFRKTAEPPDAEPRRVAGSSFVVQKHAARRLHYDLRLELDGVLKSWAVTRGPSLDPADRRLAVHTEDHPLAYGAFEGVIPQGQYGGGTVMLWDRGVWMPIGDPHRSYQSGKLKFTLDGERLHGGWTLVRMGGKAAREGRDNWLLIKERDDHAKPGAGTSLIDDAMTSVASERTMAAIAADRERVWRSADAGGSAAGAPGDSSPISAVDQAPPATLPRAPRPQLAMLAERAPAGPGWIHEIKFDGYRAMAVLKDGAVRMFTRSGLDWTERFRPLADALTALPVRRAVLDGEVVALDEGGLSSFSLLQDALAADQPDGLAFQAFDLLHLDGRDMAALPLVERKAVLRALIARLPAGPVSFSDHWDGAGARFFQQACSMRLEGMVSKRADAPYRPGRSRDWLKVKCTQRQELVIGGFIPSQARPGAVASLLVGYHRDGRLVYAGRVGTGMSDATATDLRRRLESIGRGTPPFAAVPKAAAKGAVWAQPRLVCEVAFASWTADGLLRHASFQGLRMDKTARGIEREKAVSDDDESPADALERLGVRLTSPDKVLYAEAGLTKRDLADYYLSVAERILPHVAGRPLSLVRCPEGSDRECFYQRHPGRGLSEHVRTVPLEEDGKAVEGLAVDDVRGLVALVQMGALEIHPWGSRIDAPDRPDRLIFDLDPDTELPFSRVVEAAHALRSFLVDLGLESFVKTTGGKGLHLVVPIVRRHGWDEAKRFTKAVAAAVVRAAPDDYTDSMSKQRRRGKIYIDYLRNDRGATAVAAWSTRARAGAPISLPLAWEDLTPTVQPADFSVGAVASLLARRNGADPWTAITEVRQSITARARRLVSFERYVGAKRRWARRLGASGPLCTPRRAADYLQAGRPRSTSSRVVRAPAAAPAAPPSTAPVPTLPPVRAAAPPPATAPRPPPDRARSPVVWPHADNPSATTAAIAKEETFVMTWLLQCCGPREVLRRDRVRRPAEIVSCLFQHSHRVMVPARAPKVRGRKTWRHSVPNTTLVLGGCTRTNRGRA
ncbi:MAG: DNA ligase D [Alphaproteobacteria bacterium]